MSEHGRESVVDYMRFRADNVKAETDLEKQHGDRDSLLIDVLRYIETGAMDGRTCAKLARMALTTENCAAWFA